MLSCCSFSHALGNAPSLAPRRTEQPRSRANTLQSFLDSLLKPLIRQRLLAGGAAAGLKSGENSDISWQLSWQSFPFSVTRTPGFTRLHAPLRRWTTARSEEHTSELQSQSNLVCRLLLEKK